MVQVRFRWDLFPCFCHCFASRVNSPPQLPTLGTRAEAPPQSSSFIFVTCSLFHQLPLNLDEGFYFSMATASTRPPHPRTRAVQGCRRATLRPAWLRQIRDVKASERPALGGLLPTDAAEAGGSIPEMPRGAAASVGWGGLCWQRRAVPSWMCAFAAASRQPGSITLGAEARAVHINRRRKLTPTRTTFIPTNYLCRGAAIKHVSAATAV